MRGPVVQAGQPADRRMMVGSPPTPGSNLRPALGEKPLSPRQRQIVEFVATSQLSNKELAAALGLAEGTLKNHLHEIYARLGVEGRRDLILRYRGASMAEDGNESVPRAKVPGLKAQHAVITPVCRANRGADGAFEEAIRRLREEYRSCQTEANAGANFHLVLTVERLR